MTEQGETQDSRQSFPAFADRGSSLLDASALITGLFIALLGGALLPGGW